MKIGQEVVRLWDDGVVIAFSRYTYEGRKGQHIKMKTSSDNSFAVTKADFKRYYFENENDAINNFISLMEGEVADLNLRLDRFRKALYS